MNTFVTLQEPTIVMYYHPVLVEFPPRCQSFSENGLHRHLFQSSLIFLVPFGLGVGHNYEFEKGQYTFYPLKLSCFAEKNKVRRKYQNFIRRDPYEPGQMPL